MTKLERGIMDALETFSDPRTSMEVTMRVREMRSHRYRISAQRHCAWVEKALWRMSLLGVVDWQYDSEYCGYRTWELASTTEEGEQ